MKPDKQPARRFANGDFVCDRERNGATALLEALVRNGVDTVFGIPGGTVIPLYDELLEFEAAGLIRHVLTRHEQGAIHAAEGYARVTGKTGVVFATSGPGAANLMTGFLDAHLDSTPLVVIGGQVSTGLIGKDAFQECDMMGMTNPVTKHNFQVRDVNALVETVDEAFLLAAAGRPGPVYIDLPKDVQSAKPLCVPKNPPKSSGQAGRLPVDRHAVKRAANLIRNAKRPLIIAGQGSVISGASSALRKMMDALKIPTVTTILAKGIVDEKSRLCLGTLGMHGRRAANDATAACDVMLVLGCRFSDRVTGETKSFAKGKKIIHVDIDSYEIGKNVPASVELNCDVNEAVEALLEELEGFAGGWTDWMNNAVVKRGICNRCISDEPRRMIIPKYVMTALNRTIAPDDIVVTGVGQHQMFATHYLYRQRPRTFVTSGGAGTMGFGLPAAVGASLGAPEATVWCIDGDGSVQMTIQELGTLAALNTKVVLLILDNGYFGMVRQWQELFGDRRYSQVKLPPSPDFVSIAKSYGISGRRIEAPADLKGALETAKSAAESTVLHILIEPESNIEPMIPPGGGIRDFFGYCVKKPGQFFTEEQIRAVKTDSDQTSIAEEIESPV
jgi:acetolactate synthase-1/2/3 large subunit